MKTTKKIWGALAISTILAGTTVGVLAQPDTAAPKGDNPPNANRPPRDKRNRPDKRGGQNKPSPLLTVSAEDLQKLLGDNLTDAQKAQLSGAVEERDLAIKAAEDRFKAQLLQASGLDEKGLREKMREHMQKMREERNNRADKGDRANRPNRPDRKPLPPEPAPAPPADAMPDNDG